MNNENVNNNDKSDENAFVQKESMNSLIIKILMKMKM